MSAVRVFHLGKYYHPATGGIETHVHTLAQAQAELGMDVTVIVVNHLNPRGRELMWSRHGFSRTVEETDGPLKVIRVGRSASVSRLDLCPRIIGCLASIPRGDEVILHLHTPNVTMLTALAAVRAPQPLVITHHSDVIRQRVLRYALRPIELMIYRRAKLICATSPTYQSRSSLLQRFSDRLDTLPLGVDLEQFLNPNPRARAFAEHIRQTSRGPIWLSVGRCVYYKGLQVAIRAMTRLPGTLRIIGSGPLTWEMQQLARHLDVADRIVWQGYATADELVGAYHAATALLLPSNARSEAFGLVQVEAMASGCPVINTAIEGSGVPWVSLHERTGLTVPIEAPDAMADAAERLLNEPGLRARLSAGARQRAQTRFNHRIMAARSALLYERVLAGESSPAPVTAAGAARRPVRINGEATLHLPIEDEFEAIDLAG